MQLTFPNGEHANVTLQSNQGNSICIDHPKHTPFRCDTASKSHAIRLLCGSPLRQKNGYD